MAKYERQNILGFLTEWSSVLIKCKQSEKLDNCSYFFGLKFGKSKITFRKNNAYCVLDFKYFTPDWHVTKYSRCRWQGLGQHCLQTFSVNKLRVCERNKKLSCYSEWKFNTKTTKLVGWFVLTFSSWSSVFELCHDNGWALQENIFSKDAFVVSMMVLIKHRNCTTQLKEIRFVP